MQSATAKTPRPTAVTVLGILSVLIGLLGIVGGALLVMSAYVIVAGLSALAVVIGILYFVTGIGFFRGMRWAWTLGIIVSVLSLIRNFAEIADGTVAYGIPGVILGVIVIYYLTRPNVKLFFGRGTKN